MYITSDAIRGHIDTIILAQLENDDSYGYEINKTVKARTNDTYEIKEATLYSAFKRLEDQGCIKSYWGSHEVGARRKYYQMTDKGREELEKNREEWINTVKIIELLIKEEKQ